MSRGCRIDKRAPRFRVSRKASSMISHDNGQQWCQLQETAGKWQQLGGGDFQLLPLLLRCVFDDCQISYIFNISLCKRQPQSWRQVVCMFPFRVCDLRNSNMNSSSTGMKMCIRHTLLTKCSTKSNDSLTISTSLLMRSWRNRTLRLIDWATASFQSRRPRFKSHAQKWSWFIISRGPFWKDLTVKTQRAWNINQKTQDDKDDSRRSACTTSLLIIVGYLPTDKVDDDENRRYARTELFCNYFHNLLIYLFRWVEISPEWNVPHPCHLHTFGSSWDTVTSRFRVPMNFAPVETSGALTTQDCLTGSVDTDSHSDWWSQIHRHTVCHCTSFKRSLTTYCHTDDKILCTQLSADSSIQLSTNRWALESPSPSQTWNTWASVRIRHSLCSSSLISRQTDCWSQRYVWNLTHDDLEASARTFLQSHKFQILCNPDPALRHDITLLSASRRTRSFWPWNPWSGPYDPSQRTSGKSHSWCCRDQRRTS